MSICTYPCNPSWRARVCSMPSTHVLHAPTKVVQPSKVAVLLAQRDALSCHVVLDGCPTVFYGAAPVLGPTSLLALRDVYPRSTRWELGFHGRCSASCCFGTSRHICSAWYVPCVRCPLWRFAQPTRLDLLWCFYPMLYVPETCVCSSFALGTAGGGASSYQHLSGGEALWYTTCALLALPAPKLRFASHLFLFAAVSFTYPPFFA